MNITQMFYDHLASQYDKLFLDWQATTLDLMEEPEYERHYYAV